MSRRFYVSTAGSDLNDGRTPQTPWRTTSRAAQAITDREAIRGDHILFRRGDTFYGQFHPNMPTVGGTEGYLRVGAYGAGANPVISGYKDSRTWTSHATNVWKLNLTQGSGDYAGNTSSTAVDVGFLKLQNGAIEGRKKWALAELSQNYDFYNDATHVYVRLPYSPGIGVKFAVRDIGVRPVSYLRWTGVDVVGFGAHAFNFRDVDDVHVWDCTVQEAGGCELEGRPGVRYGNAFEIWVNCSNVLVERVTMRQVYDTATTFQGEVVDNAKKAWTNCHYRHNIIEDCTQSFELWARGLNPSGAGLVNCSFTHNVCRNAGNSWGYDVRPDKNKGVHILTYGLELPLGLEVAHNVFDGAKDGLAFFSTASPENKVSEVKFHDNQVHLKPGQKITNRDAETIEQLPAYAARTGREKGTLGYVSPTQVATAADALALVSSKAAVALGTERAMSAPSLIPATIESPEALPDMIRLLSSTTGNDYAKWATIKLSGANAIVTLTAAFQDAGNSQPRRAFGTVAVAASGGGSTGTAAVEINVTGKLYEAAGRFRADNFKAVATSANDTTREYTVELWVQMGQPYANLQLRPLLAQASTGARVLFERESSVVASLPSGTQYTPAPAYGTVAPTHTPASIGQEYIDTAARKVYKAVATSGGSAWVALN